MKNRNRYVENWEDTIRPRILKRDNYQCVVCGVKHRKTYVFEKDDNKFIVPDNEIEEWKKFGDKCYKVYLQVCHLDNNPDNNEDYNLSSMCPKHHLKYDREFKNLMRIAKRKVNA